jgi:lipopolysaccharide transport system ATP-binding protein
VLTVQDISKKYLLFDKPADRLWQAIGSTSAAREFWAVKNVSFQANPGEVFGIVGPNGSGKSTLLQIVAGILSPTHGRVQTQGRVAALLELGAGFNPEFTGRENARLNCELQGLAPSEIDACLVAIEEFAQIGEFFDRPTKEYSSGMYVRLAFSTAIQVDPDILIVDEALAVGDAAFSSKCIRKMMEFKASRKTMLFVSHDLGLVKQLCDRALLMWKGQPLIQGDPNEVCNRYVAEVQSPDAPDSSLTKQSGEYGDRAASILKCQLLNEQSQPTLLLQPGELARLQIIVRANQHLARPMIGLLIRTRKGLDVFGTNTRQQNCDLGAWAAGQTKTIEFKFRTNLARLEYTITVAAQQETGECHHWIDDLITFQVAESRDLAGFVDLFEGVSVL